MNKLSLSAEKINVRKMNFSLTREMLQDYIKTDPIKAHFLNSLSVLFPAGERFFIDSVKYFRDEIKDPELAASVKKFIGQETTHTNEHLLYNTLLQDCGYDVNAIYRRLDTRLEIVRSKVSEINQLAGTLGFEHYTAVLADLFLLHRDILAKANPEFARLWYWHAMEELEHKAVAFDVFANVHGGYLSRITQMFVISVYFMIDLCLNMGYFLQKDGKLFHPLVLLQGIKFFWIYPAVIPRVMFSFLQYLLPGFHPWKKNNYHLVKELQEMIVS